MNLRECIHAWLSYRIPSVPYESVLISTVHKFPSKKKKSTVHKLDLKSNLQSPPLFSVLHLHNMVALHRYIHCSAAPPSSALHDAARPLMSSTVSSAQVESLVPLIFPTQFGTGSISAPRLGPPPAARSERSTVRW